MMPQNAFEAWRQSLDTLTWTRTTLDQTVRAALAKAEWLGIDRHQAIHAILERTVVSNMDSTFGFLLQTWANVALEVQTLGNQTWEGGAAWVH